MLSVYTDDDGGMKYDYSALGGWYWQGEAEILGVNLSRYHYVSYKSSLDWRGIEHRFSRSETHKYTVWRKKGKAQSVRVGGLYSYHFTSKNDTPLSYLFVQRFLNEVLKQTNRITLTLTHRLPQFVKLPAGDDVRKQELCMKTDGRDFPKAGRR